LSTQATIAREFVSLRWKWDENQHPREPAGSPGGGQFTSDGGGGGTGEAEGGAPKEPELEKLANDKTAELADVDEDEEPPFVPDDALIKTQQDQAKDEYIDKSKSDYLHSEIEKPKANPMQPSMKPIKFEPRQAPQPLRRDPPMPPGNTFFRICAAIAKAQLAKAAPADIAETCWPQDRVVTTLLRAASTPAMTSTSGWASQLAHIVVADIVSALGAVAAAGELLRLSLTLNFNGAGQILVPGLVADATKAAFVAEGAPIAVEQMVTTSATLLPHKIATIAALTREMIESSNAEQLVGDALSRAIGLALDAVLFDANAASAIRPAGLRNGIAALTASTNTDLFEAALEDLAALMNAVSTVGGSGPYVLITSPGRGISMGGRMYRDERMLIILPSTVVGNDIIAVAPAGLAAAIAPNPDIELANQATLHMEDVAPAAIVDGGTMVAPHRSLFQTDSLGLKCRLPVTWALRDTRAVAWMTPVWK
jgi:hypothetical protein